MAKSLPLKAKVGVPGKTVNISTPTYFIAKRMEDAGMLRPGAGFNAGSNAAEQPYRAKEG